MGENIADLQPSSPRAYMYACFPDAWAPSVRLVTRGCPARALHTSMRDAAGGGACAADELRLRSGP